MIEVKEEKETLHEPELKQSLEKFDDIIINVPDENQFIVDVKNFLISFLKTKTNNTTLPINDVMAIIKKRKPNIYSGLKRVYRNNMIMYMITNLDTDYDEAYRRLNKLKQQLGIIKKY